MNEVTENETDFSSDRKKLQKFTITRNKKGTIEQGLLVDDSVFSMGKAYLRTDGSVYVEHSFTIRRDALQEFSHIRFGWVRSSIKWLLLLDLVFFIFSPFFDALVIETPNFPYGFGSAGFVVTFLLIVIGYYNAHLLLFHTPNGTKFKAIFASVGDHRFNSLRLRKLDSVMREFIRTGRLEEPTNIINIQQNVTDSVVMEGLAGMKSEDAPISITKPVKQVATVGEVIPSNELSTETEDEKELADHIVPKQPNWFN